MYRAIDGHFKRKVVDAAREGTGIDRAPTPDAFAPFALNLRLLLGPFSGFPFFVASSPVAAAAAPEVLATALDTVAAAFETSSVLELLPATDCPVDGFGGRERAPEGIPAAAAKAASIPEI
jgi:hypothetical protein